MMFRRSLRSLNAWVLPKPLSLWNLLGTLTSRLVSKLHFRGSRVYHLGSILPLFQGFLKNERENALLSVIEHARKNVSLLLFALLPTASLINAVSSRLSMRQISVIGRPCRANGNVRSRGSSMLSLALDRRDGTSPLKQKWVLFSVILFQWMSWIH